MRISAIGRVHRSNAERVDSIHWHESARRVQSIDAQEAARTETFRSVMDQLKEEPHRRRMRVMEVVSAPGVSGHRFVRAR
ncbi:MAG TPA: hypothetical protein DCE42_05175 [Myxococcales bacterium]|nr:hypothetical protein [Deltaproteobacteria bacterium]HAA54123.1 hypothetical protein [Myxococcales bacterium]